MPMEALDSDLDDVPLASRWETLRDDLPLSRVAEGRKAARLVVPNAGLPLLSEVSERSNAAERGGPSRKKQKGIETSNDVATPVRSSPRRRDALLALQSSPLTSLPCDLQLQILQRVCCGNAARACQLATVCSLWRQLSYDAPLWKKLVVPKTNGALFDDKRVGRLCSKGTLAELEVLKMKGSVITDKALIDLPHACPHLTALNIADCQGLTGTGILQLAKSQGALRAVTLSRLRGRAMNDSTIKALITERPELEYLRLKGFDNLGSSSLRAIATGLHNLKYLDLTKAGSMRAVNLPITLLQANCPLLEVLRVSGLGSFPASWSPWLNMGENSLARSQWQTKYESTITQRFFGRTSEEPSTSEEALGFPHLQELRIACELFHEGKRAMRDYTQVTDAVLWLLLRGSPKLRILDISHLANASPDLLYAIPAEDLEVLLMAGCQALRYAGLETAVHRWGHSLTHLDVSHSSAVCNLQFVSNKCQALRTLNVSYTAIREADLRGVLSNQYLKYTLTSMDTTGCRTIGRELRLPGDFAISVLKEKLGLIKSPAKEGGPLERKTKAAKRKNSGKSRESTPQKQTQSEKGKGKRPASSGTEKRKRRAKRPFGMEADTEDDSDYTPGKQEEEDTYAWD